MEKPEAWIFTVYKQEGEGKGVKVEKPEYILMFSTTSDKGKAIQCCLH